MIATTISKRMNHLFDVLSPVQQFFTASRWAKTIAAGGDAPIADFTFGNPHEMPLTGFVDALQKWSVPQDPNWFAYKMSEENAREVAARSLQQRLKLPFETEDIFMTPGAFAAIAVSLRAVVDPGDEIIYISPPWFYYEPLILSVDGIPVRVRCHPRTFDLDLEAIERAITPRTRGILVNSPNNPTGRIYPAGTLQSLADLLLQASRRNGRPIYLFSDEAYQRIVYDGRAYTSPLSAYPYSFLIYTYGKTLLTPGQRLGYIALAPALGRALAEKEKLRGALLVSQLVSGYAFPNALLQHSLADLEKLSIDVSRLQAKRDRLVPALQSMGYDAILPEGTFYVLVRSPLEDDLAFIDLLADQGIYCLPGSVFDLPGYFRISLTATDEMIDRALPGFASVASAVGAVARARA